MSYALEDVTFEASNRMGEPRTYRVVDYVQPEALAAIQAHYARTPFEDWGQVLEHLGLPDPLKEAA